MKEYFAYLNGSLINNEGYISRHGVTAYTKKEAMKLLAKAKMYYYGTYKVDNCRVVTR